jgi:predicted HicB family RNase H-like nuclease
MPLALSTMPMTAFSSAVFHGTTVDELEAAFHELVDHYLEVSERTGRPAQKPYSGKLSLRIDPETRAAMALAAELSGTSIKQWCAHVLKEAAHG